MPDIDLEDAETGEEALTELRRLRRHNRLVHVHWVDAFYRVYMAALGAVIFIGFASSRLPDAKVSADAAAEFLRRGPGWLGLGFAVAVALGLRSGGRGGPLVIEAPVVAHELAAPVDRAFVLRVPAFKQLRFAAFVGGVAGAIIGELAARRLPMNVAAAMATCAVTFAAAAGAAVGVGMILSGYRVRWWKANLMAVIVIAWSVLDVATSTISSPLTLLARIAFWPLGFDPIALGGLVVAIAAAFVGIRCIGGISIEAAQRRASLVAQLRFAVTLQDVRTVVLLRRQLSQEHPRARPWFKMPGAGRLPPIWQRDWAGFLRFPATRLIRMAALGAIGGIALGFTWRGVIPAILIAGGAIYLAAYDASEPIAQEVDHPTRWESYPDDPGRILLNHIPATAVMTILICGVAAASSLILVPAQVVRQLLFVMVTTALAATVGAGVGTAQGAPDAVKLTGLGPDMMGFFMIGRLVLPPLLTTIALLPLLAAGSDPAAINTTAVANGESYAIFALLGAFLWLRYRKPRHL